LSLAVKFWGVRGSIACPSPDHVVYGGNTSCLEIIAGDERIIMDAGTGIRNLGQEFIKDGVRKGTLLLTHSHWDHINGFPFFGPAFMANSRFTIAAGHLYNAGGIENVLASQMANPTFPVPLEALQATLTFEDFKAGDSWNLDAATKIVTMPLNHPNGATGYRVEHGGKAICYVTDTEHVIGKPDQNVLKLIEGADIVIYDCTYTDQEFKAKIGWGHSTWQEGVRLCKMANVRQLAIFHHDPDHNDDFMRQVEVDARKEWEGTVVSREQMILVAGV
jgi:phosphoribosyl 1,2-cyclic phosphodiesterase